MIVDPRIIELERRRDAAEIPRAVVLARAGINFSRGCMICTGARPSNEDLITAWTKALDALLVQRAKDLRALLRRTEAVAPLPK